MSDAAGAGAPAGHKEVLAGRYRLIRRLAEGGMGTVWEGRDEVLARAVAIKIPHTRLAADPSARERFRREAVAAARLAHPGIVATYDTGADGPIDFIVMELVPGRTVRDLVAGGPVAPAVAVAVAAQVAEALDAAHKAGLIHRDIKPANLLVVEDAAVLRVKVADFGVARAQEALDEGLGDASVTREGVVVGTARYLAPEQVSARPLDGRTDLYALGCVLHELLAGQPPFVRDTDLAIALAHLTEPPTPLRTLGVPVGPELEALVLACLAKDPAQRPSSALSLGQQLRTLEAAPAAPATAAVPVIDLPGRAPAPRTTPPAWPGEATVSLPAAPPSQLSGAGPPVAPPGPVPGIGRRQPSPATAPPAPSLAPSRRPGRTRRTRRTPTGRRGGRSRVPLIVVGVLVAAALATALAVVALPGGPRPGALRPTVGPAATGPPVIAAVRSFDPAPGDGQENESQLPRLIDSDPATTWSSDRYRQPPVFGNLKKGVGVVVTLRQPTRIGRLRVRSASQAWAAQVYLGAAPAPTLSAWGQPVARASGVDGDLDVSLNGQSAGALLLWFTDPGRTGQVVIGELELSGP